MKDFVSCDKIIVDEGREDALSGGGLDLIIFPGMGFTKVYIYIN